MTWYDGNTTYLRQGWGYIKLIQTSLCVGTNFHGIPSATSALNCTTINFPGKKGSSSSINLLQQEKS